MRTVVIRTSASPAGRSRYENLLARGEDVAWYGDWIDPEDGNAVLMQCKLPDGRYEVMFVNGGQRDVTAEELVELLAGMLRKKTR